MITLIIRILVFAGIFALILYIVKSILQSSAFVRCERCDGKGYWLGARGREKCDWCKGDGKIPRAENK